MKKRISDFYKRIIKVMKRPDMMYLPGQIAFFLVLAIIPTMTLLSFIASILNLSLDFIHQFLTVAFSKTIADLILSVSPIGGGFSFAVVLFMCYYLSSNGTSSIIVASNTIYGIKNKNFFEFLKDIEISFVYTLPRV